jgi:hypothetical protein
MELYISIKTFVSSNRGQNYFSYSGNPSTILTSIIISHGSLSTLVNNFINDQLIIFKLKTYLIQKYQDDSLSKYKEDFAKGS